MRGRNSAHFASRRSAENFRKHYEDEYKRLSFELGLNQKKKKKKKKKSRGSPSNQRNNHRAADLNYENSVTKLISQKLSLLESKYNSGMQTEHNVQNGNWVDTQGRFMQGLQMLHKDERRSDHEYAEFRRKALLHATKQAKKLLGSPGPGDYRMYQRKKRKVRRRSISGKPKSRPTYMDKVLQRSQTIPGPSSYSDGVNKSSIHGDGMRFTTALKFKKNNNKNPGPGEYTPVKSTLKTNGVSHFLTDSTRHLDKIVQHAASIPGPADYGAAWGTEIETTTPDNSPWDLDRAMKSMRKIAYRTK